MALVFRDTGTSGTQIDVLSNELRIAHIGKEVLSVVASHDVRWRWNFAVTVGPTRLSASRPRRHIRSGKGRRRRELASMARRGGTESLQALIASERANEPGGLVAY
jgi:hypothetical protein